MNAYRLAALTLAVCIGAAVALSVLPRAIHAAGFTDLTAMQSFAGGTGWINSQPLGPADLKGKIVLVDFWEYTCINCIKTLPYEKAWYERYHKYGFEIVGVHTPEFKFAGERANVAAAVKRFGITWPVVLDDDMTIWNRYHNEFWPHDFLFDRSGRIAADHVGEGDYPDMEANIQRLVRTSYPGAKLPQVMGYLDSYAKPGAVCYPQTAETYVGPWRGDGAVASPQGYQLGKAVTYRDDGRDHRDGRLYLEGPWLTAEQAMVHARADASASDYIDLRYHAIEVASVLKPETSKPVTVYVDQDGKPLAKEDAGADIRYDDVGRAYLVVDAPREYAVVKNKRFGHHDLLLRPVQYGLGVYSFAFESCEVGADRY